MTSLDADVAQRIVDRTMAVLDRNVNVMDDRGLILASGSPQRLRQRHEGALLAAQQDRVVVIDAAEAKLLQGVQPGVNLPLHYRGQVVGVVGISGSPDQVQVYADLIKVAAELMVEQAATLEHGQALRQEREDFLAALVTGQMDDTVAQRRAVDLGIPLEAARGCTVIRTDADSSTDVLRPLQRQLAHLGELLTARTGPDELVVWWPGDSPHPRETVWRALEVDTRLTGADGEVFAGPNSLRRSWITAHDAIDVLHLAPDLYDHQDLALVALLSSLREDWRADAVSRPWRALVAADASGELRTTLRAWIDHGQQPGACAEALHVHRNTLRGRLERIEKITGLSLRRVPSLLQLYVGPLLVRTAV